MTPQGLQEKLLDFSNSYFLTDIRKDREAYYALTVDDLNTYWICMGGYILNLYMDGDIDKANRFLSYLPEDNFMRLALTVVNPSVELHDFIKTLNTLKKNGIKLQMVVLTAGRPYLLNGFNDFSRLGPFWEKYKKMIVEDINFLYGTESSTYIYNLSLAEYYYQCNRLIDAELLVSKTIKEFDKKGEFRFLFVALYLEAKIAIANGTITKFSSYIKDIKDRVKKIGKAEFSNNIDAAEVSLSLCSGSYELVSSWMKADAPDEIGDFNMLDLYRYMVKIRCYIVLEDHSSAVALIEKLRPLLEQGRRPMDLCEIDLLLSEVLFAAGKKALAFEALERALKIARHNKYIRLVADEGVMIFPVIHDYAKEKGLENKKDENDFFYEVMENSRAMAIQYPLYLKGRYNNNEHFTQMEIDILNLLQQGKSNEEIGEYFFISVNTVKYHLKKIYSKLGVNGACQAVWNGRLLGLIK